MLAVHGRTAETSAHYTDALRLKPTYVAMDTQLGIALRTQGKLDEERNDFAEALRLDPNDAAAEHEVALVRASRRWDRLMPFSG